MQDATGLQDPFLLLAHHDHWFDPRDPLREPFKAVGKTLGLPYVDVEGFSMHPHRGFDIWTYVLDGSDGFRHKDSLDSNQGGTAGATTTTTSTTTRTYRGGTAQWMRTGAGVTHEEFWETRPDKRTNIELFQLWVNLPASHKFDPPAIRYLGKDATTDSHQWIEDDIMENNAVVGTVRNLGVTLHRVLASETAPPQSSSTALGSPGPVPINENAPLDAIGEARQRPPVQIMHTTITKSGGRWTVEAPLDHSALIYVRKGVAKVRGIAGDAVITKAQQTATFGHNGDTITIENNGSLPLDILLLMAAPLREPVVQAGPIVMNSAAEINDAYQQLQDGTFLDRNHVIRQQKQRV